jgi:hypothetical protein
MEERRSRRNLRGKIIVLFVDFSRPRASERYTENGRPQMQYLLLIYHDEGRWGALAEAERQEIYAAYRALQEELQRAGKLISGNELQPTSTATTLRVRNGKAGITKGPFAETKEQLGGYFLVEAEDLDDALAIAARIPSATTGSIEVRPLAMRSGG